MAARHEQILREAGIDHREALPADWNGYDQQLSILLTRPGALSERLDQLATLADELSAQREATAAYPLRTVALAQVPECREFCEVMQYVVMLICAIVMLDPAPGDEAICLALTMAIAAYCLLARWAC